MIGRRVALSLLAVSLLVGQLNCSGQRQGGMQAPPGSHSQPHFKPGINLFSPEQDVEIGRQSAQQIMTETPMLDDPEIDGYIEQLGAKLASKAAGERFPYQFQVVATREINAFALPGGFLFVNAGAIAAARNEGELAGVIAHEIAHVSLRHGTNQATKARLARAGLGILGGIAGAGSGSDLGQAIGAIGGLGANMLFLKYGRAAEKEADLEGARIMVEAGYDPRDMANFFKTLEQQGGRRVPEMMSDHPDPGDRVKYITEEISRLPISLNPVHTTPEFEAVRSRLIGREPSLSEDSRLRRIGEDPNDIELGARPPRPSAQFNGYQPDDGSFAVQVPANWDALRTSDSDLIFSPKGAYGKYKDNLMVTHGIFVGVRVVRQADLRSATEAFVQQQIEGNSDFQIAREPQPIDFGGQEGYYAVFSGPSAINGVVEVDATYTTLTADGRMFYIITIAPEDEAGVYKSAFEKIIRSLRLAR
ncbi:MAG TPA: M48 family metallopeptidase [Blastocatellia bacterium]|nr:M48 family metallopeptidase [Blastocatellia bacterium]